MPLKSELKAMLATALPDALVGENRLVKFLEDLADRVEALEQVSGVVEITTTTDQNIVI